MDYLIDRGVLNRKKKEKEKEKSDFSLFFPCVKKEETVIPIASLVFVIYSQQALFCCVM